MRNGILVKLELKREYSIMSHARGYQPKTLHFAKQVCMLWDKTVSNLCMGFAKLPVISQNGVNELKSYRFS